MKQMPSPTKMAPNRMQTVTTMPILAPGPGQKRSNTEHAGLSILALFSRTLFRGNFYEVSAGDIQAAVNHWSWILGVPNRIGWGYGLNRDDKMTSSLSYLLFFTLWNQEQQHHRWALVGLD